jgi:phosphate-selective porin OprO/OprP
MKPGKKIVQAVATGAAVLLLGGVAHAEGFLLGEEGKGITVKAAENTDLNVRIRLQPRFDAGDLITSDETTPASYEGETDFYLRRIRLELGGHIVKNLRFNLTVEGDKNSKAPGKSSNEVKILYAYGDYKIADPFSIRFGKAKLPYSRVSLTSSSKQLLIERPFSTEDAKKLFDDYYQAHLLLHGKIAGGAVAYSLAGGDGWEPGSSVNGKTVHKSGPLYAARLELSPPEWAEKSQSDAHLGKGRHLAVGANYAAQGGIEYASSPFEEDRSLWGADLSGHWEGFTFQGEYNAWKEEFTDPASADKEPKGWYVQAGYFIPGVNVEPAVRYEVYEQDSNKTDTEQRTVTAGVNWYLKGHSVKLNANYAMTEFDKNAKGFLANDDKQNVFQVQGQLYF